MDKNSVEKKVLEEISKRLVMKKEEIVSFLENEIENPFSAFKEATQNLSIHGFIRYVNEIGAFTITQKGIKEVNKNEEES
jgi:hypothetical protein